MENVLKKEFFEFVNETTFVLPKNKDILKILSNILKNNIIILNDSDFHKVCDESFDKTVVISSKKTRVFNTINEAEMTIVGEGFFEYVNIDSMKINELKEYIVRYNLEVGSDVKKKADLVSKIKELKTIKN